MGSGLGRDHHGHMMTRGLPLPSAQLLLELRIAMFTKSVDVVTPNLKNR